MSDKPSTIRVVCPTCGKGVKAPEKYRGREVKCPGCDAMLSIPAAPAAAATSVEDANPFRGLPDTQEPAAERQPPVPPAPPERSASPPPLIAREETVLRLRPSMLRNRPVRVLLLLSLGLLGAVFCLPDESRPFGAAVLGFSALSFAVWYLAVINTRLIVTNKRTTYRRGILAKRTREVRHRDVRLLQVDQSVPQRLTGVGTLSVGSAGHGGIEIAISGITNPQKVRQVIDDFRE